jgi:Baseplate J-like protein
MHVIEPMETIHLYVVPEDQLPPKRDAASVVKGVLCFLILLVFISLSLTTPSPDHEVAFTLTLHGFSLAPVSKSLTVQAIATGKGSIAATTATGTITFYNGALYTQIIPIGTILKGSDGVSVSTDEQAVIPPAAQTTPPTYGQVSVSAHALHSGEVGNIAGGDVNMACCVTSVIAQNPYSFTEGKNARSFMYVTSQDVTNAVSPILPRLQLQTLALFPTTRVLDPICKTTLAKSGLTVHVTQTCTAHSYSLKSLSNHISAYKRNLGIGTLTNVQSQVIDISKGVIQVYVTAIWKPIVVRHLWSGK